LGFYRGHVMNWPFLVAGLTMVAIGVFMFARFLRDYPIPVEEA
jgi:hypothetical protein